MHQYGGEEEEGKAQKRCCTEHNGDLFQVIGMHCMQTILVNTYLGIIIPH